MRALMLLPCMIGTISTASAEVINLRCVQIYDEHVCNGASIFSNSFACQWVKRSRLYFISIDLEKNAVKISYPDDPNAGGWYYSNVGTDSSGRKYTESLTITQDNVLDRRTFPDDQSHTDIVNIDRHTGIDRSRNNATCELEGGF